MKESGHCMQFRFKGANGKKYSLFSLQLYRKILNFNYYKVNVKINNIEVVKRLIKIFKNTY